MKLGRSWWTVAAVQTKRLRNGNTVFNWFNPLFWCRQEKTTEILGMVQPEKKYWDFLVYFLMFCCFMIIQGGRGPIWKDVIQLSMSSKQPFFDVWAISLDDVLPSCDSKLSDGMRTLSPIIMEVETGRIWKGTALGLTYLSLPCLWEEGSSSFVGVGSWHLVDYVGSLESNHIGLWDFLLGPLLGWSWKVCIFTPLAVLFPKSILFLSSWCEFYFVIRTFEWKVARLESTKRGWN